MEEHYAEGSWGDSEPQFTGLGPEVKAGSSEKNTLGLDLKNGEELSVLR